MRRAADPAVRRSVETSLAGATGNYYVDVARFVLEASGAPAIVGVQGPQGGGKSTLCEALVRAMGAAGLRADWLSIDDFYLTHAEQRALAARHPNNRYLAQRGAPGTHDVAFAEAMLDGITSISEALATLGSEGHVLVPQYDKGAHGGLGDRVPESQFRRVPLPLDVLLFEGWMVGFAPVGDAALDDPDLAPIDRALAAYVDSFARFDAFVALTIDDLEHVARFRVDAERARRARGEGALSDEAADDYVRRFFPMYRTYVPGLLRSPPGKGPALRVALDGDRRATAVTRLR